MIDLNRFVPRGSHLTLTDGEAINDRGEIAASGMLAHGDFDAVVLIPCNGGQGCRDGGRGCPGRRRTLSVAVPHLEPAEW
jgi:hypothetical protein